MNNRHYHGIDMSPEIMELEDGQKGYFYTPQQMEEFAWRELMDRCHDYSQANSYNMTFEPSVYKQRVEANREMRKSNPLG